MKDELGGYYTLGRWFAHAIGHPEVMRLATKYGLPRTDADALPAQAHGQPAEPRGGDATTASSTASRRIAPAA